MMMAQNMSKETSNKGVRRAYSRDACISKIITVKGNPEFAAKLEEMLSETILPTDSSSNPDDLQAMFKNSKLDVKGTIKAAKEGAKARSSQKKPSQVLSLLRESLFHPQQSNCSISRDRLSIGVEMGPHKTGVQTSYDPAKITHEDLQNTLQSGEYSNWCAISSKAFPIANGEL